MTIVKSTQQRSNTATFGFFVFNSLAPLGGWWIAEDYWLESKKWQK